MFLDFFGWYENGSEVFIAMEYVQYGDLGNYMKKEAEKARASVRDYKTDFEGARDSPWGRDLPP